MIDFSSLMQIKGCWNLFKVEHPSVESFIKEVRNTPTCEGMEIEISIKYPDGKEVKTDMCTTQSDLYFLDAIKRLIRSVS